MLLMWDLQILVLVGFQLKSNFRTASTRRLLAAKENALEGATKLRIEDGIDDLRRWMGMRGEKRKCRRRNEDDIGCLGRHNNSIS